MRLIDEARIFDSNMAVSGQAFQIKASAKAFKILSDQLYQKKELAIVRELTANAWDAHVCAGTTATPIKVHMPTSLESWFEITDYGTGLSDAAIHELYTTYFASNKTDSDELIGGFGLGSKSPFAYCDQFTVVSRYDHVRREYQVYIGADGVPTIVRINELATTEAPGLTVRVPVNNSHIQNFRVAADEVFPFLPTAPKVNVPFTPVNFLIDAKTAAGVRYGITAAHDWSNRYILNIVQGNVRYPVSVSDLGLTAILPGNTHIFVPIGAVEVSASREALSLDDATKKTLIELHDSVVASYMQEAEHTLEAAAKLGKIALHDAFSALQVSGVPVNSQHPTAIAIRAKFDFGLHFIPGTALLYTEVPHRGKNIRGQTIDTYTRLDPTNSVVLHSYYSLGEITRVLPDAATYYWLDTLRPYLHFFENGPGAQKRLIIRCDRAQLDTYVAELGLDIAKMEPIPKAPARVKGAATKKYGTAVYFTRDFGVSNYRSLTADQLLNGELKSKAIVYRGSRPYDADAILETFAAHQIVDLTDVQMITLPYGHTKVYQALQDAGASGEIPRTDAIIEYIGYDMDALITAHQFHSAGTQINAAREFIDKFLPWCESYEDLCPEYAELRAMRVPLTRTQQVTGLWIMSEIIDKALAADPTLAATATNNINTMCNTPIAFAEAMVVKYGPWIAQTSEITRRSNTGQYELMARICAQINNP